MGAHGQLVHNSWRYCEAKAVKPLSASIKRPACRHSVCEEFRRRGSGEIHQISFELCCRELSCGPTLAESAEAAVERVTFRLTGQATLSTTQPCAQILSIITQYMDY